MPFCSLVFLSLKKQGRIPHASARTICGIHSQAKSSTRKGSSPLHASVTVTNPEKVAGDEVVQLYLKFPNAAGAPRRALRGFQRIHLEPGANQKVEFQLNLRDLSMVTDLGKIIVAEGEYTLSIGGGQSAINAPSASGNFKVQGEIMMPE